MKDGIYLIEMGKKIRATRRAKGISMRKLVTLCPLHKSSLSELENGKRDCHILTLKMLADVLGVDVKDFI
ncbi:MAG: helix-turn-helix transcriptional regulator [Chitinophagaceae bacterium]|nr:helix-turn-helix transcriptional regulator [Chitinophagaceae bacterium]